MQKRVATLLVVIGIVFVSCSGATGPGGGTGHDAPIPMEPMPGSPAAEAEQGKLPSGNRGAP